ncbi:hypothetical protein AGR9A_Cc120157 [Agrobacterium salinitolerans str. Hayward 0363]|nr:hypothetical protein AGR9A_Cc120157 [Agrobacterium salinitolerans str. Hayward 0363]
MFNYPLTLIATGKWTQKSPPEGGLKLLTKSFNLSTVMLGLSRVSATSHVGGKLADPSAQGRG